MDGNKIVLPEEEYVEKLESIIARDYFPDVEKLRSKADYLEALNSGDVERARQLQLKFSSIRSTGRPNTELSGFSNATPQPPSLIPLRTPAPNSPHARDCPPTGLSTSSEIPPIGAPQAPAPGPVSDAEAEPHSLSVPSSGISKFLARFTSEDNQSFQELQAEAEKRHRARFPWLYGDDKTPALENSSSSSTAALEFKTPGEPVRLALEHKSSESSSDRRSLPVGSWPHKPKNQVFYPPESAPFSKDELLELQRSAPQRIDMKNTRLTKTALNALSMQRSRNELERVAAMRVANVGRIGLDGRELVPSATPRVGGYSLTATPSPMPGVDATPVMTWGELEGTPLELDDPSLTPLPPGASGFKMPEIPERDRIALELTEKVNKYYRERKDKAKTTVSNEMEHLRHPKVKTPSRALPGSPGSASPASASSASSSAAAAGSSGTSLTSRMEALSPAARHLVTGGLLRLGGGDAMLRASYSQSPATFRTPGSRTTPRTPGGTPTPSHPHAAASSTSSWRTPSRTPQPATPKRLPSVTQPLGATPLRGSGATSSDEGSALRSTGTKRNLTDNLLDLPSAKRPAS